jgi:hypothetical protein
MNTLRHAGVQPGAVVSVTSSPNGVVVGIGGEVTELRTQNGRAGLRGQALTRADPGVLPAF